MDAPSLPANLPWKRLFHAGATPTYVADRSGRIVDANRAFADFLRYPLGEVTGAPVMSFTAPEDQACQERDFERYFDLGGHYLHEIRFLRGDGRRVTGQVVTTVVEGERRLMLVEICEERAVGGTRSPLVQSHDLLRQIIDKAPMLFFLRDLSGRYVMINNRYAELLGKAPSDVEGRTPHELFPPDLAETYLGHDAEVMRADTSLRFEENSRDQHGKMRYWLSVKTPLHDKEGNIIGVGGMASDITELKDAQEEMNNLNHYLESANRELRSMQDQLIQAEKMESVGRLAAGVAHEVKNPLALILMGLEYFSQLPEDTDPNFREILVEMRKAVRRAEKIVHGLVDFSASRQLEIQTVDVNRVVRETLPFIKHDRLRKGVELVEDFAPEVGRVRLDVQKFEQVLLNLLINALHAVEEKTGRLRVWTRVGVMPEGDPIETGSRAAERLRKGDPVVMVGIEDNGRGISPQDLDRIFDPFYTTKATGEGTGLGLSICRKIIELHGGRIVARSEPGRGTTMTIMLRMVGRTAEGGDLVEKPRDKDGGLVVQSGERQDDQETDIGGR